MRCLVSNTRDDIDLLLHLPGLAVPVFAMLWRIVRSRFGIGARRHPPERAAHGRDRLAAYRYKLAAFVISGMGAGLAGALMANFCASSARTCCTGPSRAS